MVATLNAATACPSRLRIGTAKPAMPSSTHAVPGHERRHHGFLMFNRLQGGDETNVEPGFKAWPKTVGPNVLEYIASSAKISEPVQADETALLPLTPTQVATQKLLGVPMEYARPKEGAVESVD